MAKAAFVLALVAATLSGWLAYDRFAGSAHGRESHDAIPASASDDRVASLEKRLAVLEARPALAGVPGGGAAAGGGAGAGTASLARPGPASGSVADLERRLVRLEDADKKSREEREAAAAAAPQVMGEPMTFSAPTMLTNADEAAKHLDLTPSQKAELERISEDAKKRIEDLKKIPDESGKTWNDAQKASLEELGDGSGGIHVLFGDSGKVRAFREQTMPGRSESFGAAERRIVDDAKSQIRSGLNPDQQAKWDKAKTDGLVGGSAVDGAVSLMITGADGAIPSNTPPAK